MPRTEAPFRGCLGSLVPSDDGRSLSGSVAYRPYREDIVIQQLHLGRVYGQRSGIRYLVGWDSDSRRVYCDLTFIGIAWEPFDARAAAEIWALDN